MSSNSRIGNFSSSSIWKLMTNGKAKDSVGKPFDDYVKEKIFEKRVNRQLQNEQNSRATSWGNLIEDVAFIQLQNVQNANKMDRLKHPDLHWVGQPDYITDNIVGDIKCPFTLKSFCEMYEIETAEELKKVKPEYYWQLVSNSILAGKENCELTIFVPLENQLELIKELARNVEEENQNQFAWINWAKNEELPFLYPNSYYRPIKNLTFTPLENDKNLLLERVEKASKILNEKLK
jgi:hypothetical protein